MVEAASSFNKERNVYEHSVPVKLTEYKVSAIDVHDCVMVIGNEKGYVYPYDIMVDPKKKKVTFDPQNEGGKRGTAKIDIVKYLPRSNMIAVLVANSMQIVQSSGSELKTIQTFTRKVHSFCVNNAVYKGATSTGETLTKDQICIVTTDKLMFFYDMNPQNPFNS